MASASGSVSFSVAAASMTSHESATASAGVISSSGSKVPVPGELQVQAEDPSAAFESLSLMGAADRAAVAAELSSLFEGPDSPLNSSFAQSSAQMGSSFVFGGPAAAPCSDELDTSSSFGSDSDEARPPAASSQPVLTRTISSGVTSSGQYGGTISSEDGPPRPPGVGRLVRSDAMIFSRRAAPSPAEQSDTDEAEVADDEEEADSAPSHDAREPAPANAAGSVMQADHDESDQT